MNNSKKKVTYRRALALFGALCLILATVFFATAIQVWACPPPERPVIRAYQDGRAELIDPLSNEVIKVISEAYNPVATPSPNEEEDSSSTQVTTPPAAPPPSLTKWSSTTTAAIKVVKLEFYRVAGSVQIKKAGGTLRFGEAYAIKATVKTAQTVKNLQLEVKVPKKVPKLTSSDQKTAVTLQVSYDKGGVHHVIERQRVLTAENAIKLSPQVSTCNTSSKVSGACFSVESSSILGQSSTLSSRGLTKKGATAGITVYFNAD